MTLIKKPESIGFTVFYNVWCYYLGGRCIYFKYYSYFL